MKIVSWVLWIFLLLLALVPVATTSLAWIGVILVVFGLYQKVQKNKGKITFSKPGVIIATGFFLSWVLAFAFIEPIEEENNINQQNEIPVDKESNEPLVTDGVSEVEVDENITQEQPTVNTEPIATQPEKEVVTEPITEQPAAETEPVVEQPVNEPVVSTPAPKSEYFKNCTALRAVYPSGVASDHPAYASKHDRDKDGWACE